MRFAHYIMLSAACVLYPQIISNCHTYIKLCYCSTKCVYRQPHFVIIIAPHSCTAIPLYMRKSLLIHSLIQKGCITLILFTEGAVMLHYLIIVHTHMYSPHVLPHVFPILRHMFTLIWHTYIRTECNKCVGGGINE